MFPAVQSTTTARPEGSGALAARAPKARSGVVVAERAVRVEITRAARERANEAKTHSATSASDDPTYKPILWSEALWTQNPSGVGRLDTTGSPVPTEEPSVPVELPTLGQSVEETYQHEAPAVAAPEAPQPPAKAEEEDGKAVREEGKPLGARARRIGVYGQGHDDQTGGTFSARVAATATRRSTRPVFHARA